MIFWIIGFLVVLVALLIPILAIVLDSPVFHKLADRRNPGDTQELAQRLATLEDEVDDLNAVVRQLKEETQFLQRLLEDPGDQPPAQLPPTR